MQNQPQISYLIEATSVTQSGAIRGKSLRCYEVTLSTVTTKWGGTDVVPSSTGKMFTIKDGQIIQKKTKANLSSKYISYQHKDTIHTTVDKSVPSYGCSLFASPELALAAKYIAIQSRVNDQISDFEASITAAKQEFAKIPNAMFIADEYPEYFI